MFKLLFMFLNHLIFGAVKFVVTPHKIAGEKAVLKLTPR